MKQPPYTAPPLAGPGDKKPGLRQLLFGHLASSAYYEAHSDPGGVYILWMEFSRFGSLWAYPCVLDEPGQAPLVFASLSSSDGGDENDRLLQRWNELVTPAAFSRFRTTPLRKEEFRKIYRAYQQRRAQDSR